MTKYKAKVKDNHLLVNVKVSKDAEINTSEVDYLSKTFIRGVLKPEKKNNHKLVFSGPISVDLKYHLSKPMARFEFFLIVCQILDIPRRIKRKNLYPNKIVYELPHIYINETTKELQFVYLPLATVASGIDMLEFLRDFTYQVAPAAERDNDYLSRFLFFLNGLPKYDVDKIENYIRKEDRAAFDTIRKQDVGNSGYMTDKPKDFYDHYEKKKILAGDDENTGLLEDEDTGLLEEENTGLLEEENTGLLEDEDTGLLVEENETALIDEEGTGLLDETQIHYPSLHRVLTDEVIMINKPVFRIGKEKSYVDYFVSNNNAVSRSHADIITRGSRYFIIDLNSKNRTYVNDQPIPVHFEIEIFNNDRIKLANEEFLFFV